MLHHVVIGSGRPVLLVHGAALDHRHMVETFEPIFEEVEGWQRIYIDMPGHGKSAGRETINSQLDLLNAVMDFATTTFPGHSFALIGESRGSYIARGFAYLRPDLVDGLLLVTPGGSPTAPPGRIPKHQTLLPDPALLSEFGESERDGPEILVVHRRDIFEKRGRAILPAIPLHDPEQAARVWKAFDFPFDLLAADAVFDKPTLIVSGRQDSWSGYADAVDCLPVYPRATFALLDTAGHALVWERPELFKSLVRDWIDRMAGFTV